METTEKSEKKVYLPKKIEALATSSPTTTAAAAGRIWVSEQGIGQEGEAWAWREAVWKCTMAALAGRENFTILFGGWGRERKEGRLAEGIRLYSSCAAKGARGVSIFHEDMDVIKSGLGRGTHPPYCSIASCLCLCCSVAVV
jgi:hypothetical protein